LAFAVTFLATNVLGGGLGAGLQRGVLAAAGTLLLGRLLLTAALDVVLAAMARDRAQNAPPAPNKTGGSA
jgi:ABC-type proline/glycine betaine transport system permease subunit